MPIERLFVRSLPSDPTEEECDRDQPDGEDHPSCDRDRGGQPQTPPGVKVAFARGWYANQPKDAVPIGVKSPRMIVMTPAAKRTADPTQPTFATSLLVAILGRYREGYRARPQAGPSAQRPPSRKRIGIRNGQRLQPARQSRPSGCFRYGGSQRFPLRQPYAGRRWFPSNARPCRCLRTVLDVP